MSDWQKQWEAAVVASWVAAQMGIALWTKTLIGSLEQEKPKLKLVTMNGRRIDD